MNNCYIIHNIFEIQSFEMLLFLNELKLAFSLFIFASVSKHACVL